MIYVLGDTIIDKEIVLNSLTENNEDPNALKANVKFKHITPGGAANVAMNAKSLGTFPVCFFTAPNLSEDYKIVKRTLERSDIGVGETGTAALPVVKYRMRLNIPYAGKPITRFDVDPYSEGSVQDFDYGLADFYMARLVETVSNPVIFVVADYHKGFFNKENAQLNDARKELVVLATKTKKLLVVDPGRFLFSPSQSSWQHYESKSTVYKFNQHQALDYLKAQNYPFDLSQLSPLAVYAEVEHRAAQGQYAFDYKNLIITFGADGYVTRTEDNSLVHHYPPFRSPLPFDVCGAGDTFLAGLASGLAEERDIVQACDFAQSAAGIAVRTRGTATVTRKDVMRCESSEMGMT